MASTETAQRVLSIPEKAREGEGDRTFVGVRRALDIGSFGANAFHQAKAGGELVNEHAEIGPGSTGQEELYVLLQGSATFTVDGAEIDAPHGTAILVQPDSKRSAVATSDETICLVIGGVPGEAYRPGPMQSAEGFFDRYNEKDYAGALEALKPALEVYPGNALLLFNVACMSSLLGDRETALTALAESVSEWEPYKELARNDDDFASLRDDPKFVELIS
jgi:quercetin dioxygenase-like cupin family protein